MQELLALLQADWPLQEFTPEHFTFASSAVALVTAAIEKTFEFEDTLKAFEHLQKGSTGGKVVIHVSPKK